jgi:hypothetical protein
MTTGEWLARRRIAPSSTAQAVPDWSAGNLAAQYRGPACPKQRGGERHTRPLRRPETRAASCRNSGSAAAPYQGELRALVQAAWAAVKVKGGYLQAQLHRLRARRRIKEATIAMAA